MQRGPTPGKSFELVKDVVTLGRDVSSDIVINDSEVSRHHARFTRQGDTYHLEDLGSTNGTFVNSVRVAGGRALVSKDIVGMGETVTLVYEAVVSESAATVMAPSAGKVTEDTWKTQFDASPAPQVSAAA
ncbi:MAG: FHA domain-containing protein, partial [Chloroflexota bacterium]